MVIFNSYVKLPEGYTYQPFPDIAPIPAKVCATSPPEKQITSSLSTRCLLSAVRSRHLWK
jgi:hypothetical protein